MSAADPQSLVQWGEARRWIGKAEEDLRAAAVLAASEPPLLDAAGYHCQQAAEKLMKGLLVAAAIPVPKTHDLDRLASLAAGAHPGLVPLMEVLVPLTTWGSATRYPDMDADLGVTSSDVGEALGAIGRLRDAIAGLDPRRRSDVPDPGAA